MPHRSAARVLFILLMLLAPSRALAFLFVAGPDDSLTIPAQRAIITWKDGEENVSVEFEYSGVHGPFGWITPLPATAEVKEEGERSLNNEMYCCDWPRIETIVPDDRLSCLEYRIIRSLNRTPVTVDTLFRTAAGVSRWAVRNGWRLSPEMGARIGEYEDSGYIFSALRVEHGGVAVARADTGTVPCMRFRFAASVPEFPLGDGSFLRRPSEVHTHLIGADPHVLSDGKAILPFVLRGPLRIREGQIGEKGGVPAEAPLFIVHFRGDVSPEDPVDLRFVPYDPYAELRSGDGTRRAEATTYFGWTKPAGAADSLVAFLGRRDEAGQDVRSALWALGEIGGARAESVFVAGTKNENLYYRWSCIEGLVNRDSPEAMRVCLACMTDEDPDDLFWRTVADEERIACYEHVLTRGGDAEIGALRHLSGRYDGARTWAIEPDVHYSARSGFRRRGDWRRVVGLQSEAALAALGDSAAYGRIRERIAVDGFVMDDDSAAALLRIFAEDYGLRGLRDGTSSTFPLFSRHHWVSVNSARDLLRARPDFRDDLFRDLVSDERIPFCGKAVLLGLLDAPRPEDLALLRSLGEEALGDDRPTEITDRLGETGRVNPKLWAVAESMKRLGWSEGMIDLANALPDSDDPVRPMLLDASRRPSRFPR